MAVFYVIVPYKVINLFRIFQETCCLRLQSDWICYTWILKHHVVWCNNTTSLFC